MASSALLEPARLNLWERPPKLTSTHSAARMLFANSAVAPMPALE